MSLEHNTDKAIYSADMAAVLKSDSPGQVNRSATDS